MKLHSKCKCLISSFIIVACWLQQCCLGQSTTVRPYKFGFTIDEQQHRSEQRDERGIVMGEFGFITADGIYHVTVYATDEQGRFRILAMKNYPYESPPKTVEVMVQPKIPPKTTTTPKPLKKHNFYTEACSGCFLANGNNEPKGISGIEEKTPKSDIKPLSKPSGNSGPSSAVNPRLPNRTPSTAPETLRGKTPLKLERNLNTVLQTKAITNSPQRASNSATLHTQTDTQYSPVYSTLEPLNKHYTRNPIVSEGANQESLKPAMPGSSATSSIPKTYTESPPPVMDIIMQKVLPTLMGKKGQTSTNPTQTTTLNSKPNVVPTGQKPSSSSSNGGFGTMRRSGGSSSAANGDGDLYRFKYILDYQGHSETGKRNGNKEGSYYSIGDDNVERTIEYVANEFGYQPRIRWRKLDSSEIKSKENTLKDYEFVWFKK